MKKIFKELLPYIIIVVVVILIRTFIVTPAIVDGDSMEPTLHNKEVVILNKLNLSINDLSRFDIVVVDLEGEKVVKRLMGLPNEKIEYIDNVFYIDNQKIETPIKFEYTKDFSYELKDGEYFVMGDNRNVSKDSRSFGPVYKKNIKGTVRLVVFPFTKIGFVE